MFGLMQECLFVAPCQALATPPVPARSAARLGRLRVVVSSSSRTHCPPQAFILAAETHFHPFGIPPPLHWHVLARSVPPATPNTPFRRSPAPLPHSFAYPVHSPLPLPTFIPVCHLATLAKFISPLLPLHMYPRMVVPPPLQSLILGELSKHGASAAARITRLPS